MASPRSSGSSGKWATVLRETLSKWFDRDAMTQSAALSFYTLFSMAPLLIFVIAIGGLAFGREQVRGQLVREFARLMGRDEARTVETVLRSVALDRNRPVAGVIGFVVFAFGATAVFAQLQSSINLMWDVEPEPGPLIPELLKKRLVSFALVLALGFLLLVSLAISAAINAAQDYLQARVAIPPHALDAANVLLSFAIFAVMFGMMFRILPDAEIPWRDVVVGGLVTSALVSLGKWAIGLYLGRAALASSFGAAGSVIVILLWVYYASMLVLLGAVFTRVHARVFYDSRHAPSPGAAAVKVVKRKVQTS